MKKLVQVCANELPACQFLRKKIDDLGSCCSLLATLVHRPNILTLRRRKMSTGLYALFLALTHSLWLIPTSAAFVEFQNCLPENILHDKPLALQLLPQFVNVSFNSTSPDHRLNVTVWVNVTGSTAGTAPRLITPPTNDTNYWNSNNSRSGGKIEAIPLPDIVNKETTLYTKVNFLIYQPYGEYVSFCDHVTNGSCPLGPVWSTETVTSHVPENFPSFGFSHNLYSTYALASLAASFKVKYGDKEASEIGCISLSITPEIGSKLAGIIKFTPVAILVSTGLAILLAALWSPWGTSDPFRWTTNYGRDPDLLRLMTPGFGDCLQYIQFVTLTGGLSLSYPGFYQPIVSKFAWSTLVFNYSFFRNSPNSKSLLDGIYVTHGSYGLEKLSQLVGIAPIENMWNSMVISLLIIIVASLTIIQVGFFVQWSNRKLNEIHEEELRAKNLPFSVGNVVRILFNYFLLPIVSLSMFQLIVASQSPAHTVGLAVLLLFSLIGLTIWLLNLLLTTKPRSFLFDDFQTILLLGSIYNTYSDHAASFAVIPIVLIYLRGIAIGAIQASGLTQLVILAVCEVITILTIHGVRPFHSQTSMNAYHITFSAVRLATLFLMISFAPYLNVTEGYKGLIGYSILLMHSIVLTLGFWLNAIQTIAEVCARLAGAGNGRGQARSGFTEAFYMRQLPRRLPRIDKTLRQSHLSNVAILDSSERASYSGRLRSQSAGSAGNLLGRQSLISDSTNTEKYGGAYQPGFVTSSNNSSANREAYSFSTLPLASTSSAGTQAHASMTSYETCTLADPYYRPPRFRQPIFEIKSPGSKRRTSWTGEKWAGEEPSEDLFEPAGEISLKSGQSSPNIKSSQIDDYPTQLKADYTTREVDFYYRVRGTGHNVSTINRRSKTSEVETIRPASSVVSWFKWITSSKTKEKGKGFEVVRSSRIPPARVQNNPRGNGTKNSIIGEKLKFISLIILMAIYG
ncbi:hypothetical protein Golomagni_00949 [Golovinomyces magnicellulatus]|nr:hypothetical protein Golomagni_00949 [Golovinomyces magnicellulatus]